MPVVVERPAVDGGAESAERMPVSVADSTPILELDAELVSRLRLAHEIGFVDLEKAQQLDERRYRRLAYADGADVRRLNHVDHAVPVRQRARQDAGRHPARRATADDGDAPDALVAGDVASTG